MKKVIGVLIGVLFLGSFNLIAQDKEKSKAKVQVLDVAGFKAKVFNYEENPEEWVFEGDQPAVIDFYADWCRPCKMVAPIMEELAEEYDGQITIYKVNTDKNRELSRLFDIKSIPYILYVPMDGRPHGTKGAMKKEDYKKIFDEFLLGKKTEEKK
ncbi:MAG: thioredoxin [Chlorobi bacterium]|nr:thioredoxin [Chlorobiota bacterium]